MNDLKKHSSVDIIIVNWNSGDQLRSCLSSVYKTSSPALKKFLNVIVVDNGSKDQSLLKIQQDFPELLLINNKDNRGFGAACNQGALSSKAKYILFLNPDTVLSGGSIDIPVDFLERAENRDYAVCGIQIINERGVISRSCARFPRVIDFIADIIGISKLFPNFPLGMHLSNWNHMDNKAVDHVIGAFYLVRRDIFEKLGGFDERFFVYLEDLDLSRRIHENGQKIYYLTDAQCFHKGGGVTEKIKAQRLFYALRSRILYSFKHLDVISAIIVLTLTFLIEPLTRSMQAIISGSFIQLKNTLKAFLMLYRSMPEIFRIIRKTP